jgi:hypothetical protein
LPRWRPRPIILSVRTTRSAVVLAVITVAASADAQLVPAAPPASGTAPSSDDNRRVAHERYDQGKAAFAAGDYLLAARLFLETYHLAPHHDPLWNAARAYELAGERVRAANLYTLYLEVAPGDARDRDRATALRKDLASVLGRIDVLGNAAGTTVDGEPAALSTVYVAPGDHLVRGSVSGREVERTVTLAAGATLSVALALPPELPALVVPPVDAPPRADSARHGRPLPTTVFYVGAGLTAIGVGLTIASGVDTLNAKAAYDHAPSGSLLSDGTSKQDRTNVLFWTMLGVGVATGALGIFFVDWHAARVQAALGPGSLRVGASF